MNTNKSKSIEDVSCTEIFIQQCIEQIYKKQRQGSSFTKEGWKNILSGFNEKVRKSYDKKQMKNRFDSLKKEWKTWDNLFSKEIGISYDYANNKVIAEDKWRERKIKENLAYRKYRHNGMRFAKELDIIFKNVMASNSKMFIPSSIQQMSLGDNEDDVYRLTMDLEEGSGDSKEELQSANTGCSVEVPTNLEGINSTTNTQLSAPSGSGSIGKKKRDQGSKKKKMSSSKQIADVVSVIAITSKDRADVLKKISSNDVSVNDIVAEFLTILEIAHDCDFRLRCCNMMMHHMCRDMFVVLKGDKCALLDWLQHHAYKSPSWQEPPKH